MMFFQIFIKKISSHYSKLQLYEIFFIKRNLFLEKLIVINQGNTNSYKSSIAA